jgi:hypothetical protein
LLRYCFDTSALNKLHDHRDAANIGKALIKVASVRVTALNIIEVCKTRDPNRRISLLKFLRILTDGKEPLGVPNAILRDLCVCYRDKLPSTTVTIDQTARGLWYLLQNPDLAGDEAKLELGEWTAQIEEPILNNAKARQDTLASTLGGIQHSVHDCYAGLLTVRAYFSSGQCVYLALTES